MKQEFLNKAIPFKNLAGILLLPAGIGGTEGWMAFDTGAMQTALNRNHFPQLEGKSREIGKFDGQVVLEQVEETKLSDASVAGIPLDGVSALVMDMDYVEKSLRTLEPDLNFLGSVGIDAFDRAPVLVDYGQSTVAFAPEAEPSGWASTPLMMEALPVVTLELDGRERRFVLDTGANTCLLASELQGTVPAAPLEDAPGVYTLPAVTLAGRTYPDVAAVFTDISRIRDRVDVDGVIGYHVLSPQPSLLDFQAGTLYLKA